MKCLKCDGEGRETYDEDGRMVTDACYRCGGTGQVDEETALRTRLEYVAAALANRHVSELVKHRDSDPEGEGWAFCAAENGMTAHDYRMAHVYDFMSQFGEELSKLSRELRYALVETIEELEGRLIEETVVKPSEPQTIPATVGFDDGDDIPF